MKKHRGALLIIGLALLLTILAQRAVAQTTTTFTLTNPGCTFYSGGALYATWNYDVPGGSEFVGNYDFDSYGEDQYTYCRGGAGSPKYARSEPFNIVLDYGVTSQQIADGKVVVQVTANVSSLGDTSDNDLLQIGYSGTDAFETSWTDHGSPDFVPFEYCSSTDDFCSRVYTATLQSGEEVIAAWFKCTEASNSTCGASFDSVQMSITVYDTCQGEGCESGGGDTGGSGSGSWSGPTYDPATDDNYAGASSDFASAVSDAYQFACGGSANNAIAQMQNGLSSVLAFIPDVWGGAGIGGQISTAQNQLQALRGQMQQICQGEILQNQTDDGLITPDPTSEYPDFGGWDCPTCPRISQVTDATMGNGALDGQDTAVTGINRMNRILANQSQLMVAIYERTYGAGPVRNYETVDGPLMSELDVEENDFVTLKEGDHGQMRGAIRAAFDADEDAQPDFQSRLDLQEELEAANVPACFGDMIQETSGDGDVLEALQVAGNNIMVRIGESNIGAFTCSWFESVAPVSRIAWSFPFGGGQELVVYGPDAIGLFGAIWLALPTLLMFIACVYLVKQVV